MANELVLITGATGHIGFKTLVVALQQGYHIRAAVRSEAKKQDILSAPSVQALNPGSKLSFVVVPDLSVEGAYDEAVKGVSHIIHLASPIVLKGEIKPEDHHSALIEPAIRGTLGVLEAANRTTGIKRIVITSSISAVVPTKYFFEEELPEGLVFNSESRTMLDKAPYASDFHAYNAAKISALKATEDFVRDQKPAFEVTNIYPAFVIGKNELITDANDITLGTNGAAMALVLGVKSEDAVVGATVHVDDVAFTHVKALDPAVPAGSYIAMSDGYAGTIWQNATRIVAEKFPKAVADGVFSNDGGRPTRRLRMDSSKTEKVMGFKFLDYEEQVSSVVSHYLSLRGELSA